MASSLICATKKLSTMLYKELTSIEITIGSAIETSSGNTGFSFIKFSFIITSICDLFCWWARCSHNYEKHALRVSHSFRGSRQGLVQARTLARCSRKKATQLSAFDNCVAKRTLLQVEKSTPSLRAIYHTLPGLVKISPVTFFILHFSVPRPSESF